MTRIKHRESPTTIEHESLLPSQRAMLEIQAPEANWATLHKLSVDSKNQLGLLLRDEINPLAFEVIESPQSYRSQQLMNTMTVLADRLIKCDDPSAFSEFVSVTVRDGYEDDDEDDDSYPTYESTNGTYFTPQGFVRNPSADFRQKVVAFEMRTPKLPASENELSFHLYTDNSSADTPAWELVDDRNMSDVFPTPGRYTYDLHKAPERFPNEALSFSVITSLARIIKQSNETQE